MVGGGRTLAPGEISRAHNGVLFLDELPEFNRNVLEALREPLETGSVRLARAAAQADYPARFQFIAAMNPCPCGYLGDEQADCRCSRDRVPTYPTRCWTATNSRRSASSTTRVGPCSKRLPTVSISRPARTSASCASRGRLPTSPEAKK